jgi:hypothetical protein
VWLVVKMPPRTDEGDHARRFEVVILEDETDGLRAIQKDYTRRLEDLGDDDDRSDADGRYVALDFYTGARVEAKVYGEWRAQVDVAKPALGVS